jgi:hypothetical protein
MLVLIDEQIFLKLDDQYISLGCNFTTSVDLLFKAFWIFQVEYPLSATFVYNFMEKVFGFKIALKSSVSEVLKLFSKTK